MNLDKLSISVINFDQRLMERKKVPSESKGAGRIVVGWRNKNEELKSASSIIVLGWHENI